MLITCHAARTLACTPEQAFDLATDASRFPDFFDGFGPIPGVRAVRLDGPLVPGATREVHNVDGSVLRETVHVVERPRRHAYRLDGFRPPFGWLVGHADATWTFAPSAHGTVVEWSYAFSLASPLAAPIARPLLQVFMAGAMARCLAAMARTVIAPAARPEAAR